MAWACHVRVVPGGVGVLSICISAACASCRPPSALHTSHFTPPPSWHCIMCGHSNEVPKQVPCLAAACRPFAPVAAVGVFSLAVPGRSASCTTQIYGHLAGSQGAVVPRHPPSLAKASFALHRSPLLRLGRVAAAFRTFATSGWRTAHRVDQLYCGIRGGGRLFSQGPCGHPGSRVLCPLSVPRLSRAALWAHLVATANAAVYPMPGSRHRISGGCVRALSEDRIPAGMRAGMCLTVHLHV